MNAGKLRNEWMESLSAVTPDTLQVLLDRMANAGIFLPSGAPIHHKSLFYLSESLISIFTGNRTVLSKEEGQYGTMYNI